MTLISSFVSPSKPSVFCISASVVPEAPLRVMDKAMETLRGEIILFSGVPSRHLFNSEKLKLLLAWTSFSDFSFKVIFLPSGERSIFPVHPTVKRVHKRDR